MDYEGVVVDLDGTVYRGERVLDGAAGAIERFRAMGLGVLFVTNNPTRSPAGYVERLAGLGIEADASAVLSAGAVTAEHLADRHAGDEVFLIGSDGLRGMVTDAGVALTDEPDAADVLVTSHTYDFDYRDLTEGMWALDGADAFYGTDPDLTYPDGDGREYPGSGAITRAVAGVAEREPDRVLGKPSSVMVNLVTERLGCPPQRCLVVGDGLDTDIAMGERAGMTTVLVRTGRHDDGDAARADVTPDHVVGSLGDVPDLLA
ncbi:HAD-IIA family hydrolase [Halosegnis marinus]|uniref:HAD-IIA family hydrolase n=1 Tax=Halosegnis marinus TaxID=3034023 RepID=A0ABD5ZJS5_9EURY|nr:HAD-IIA family hydrolase [Halosegnis sp. DT85]